MERFADACSHPMQPCATIGLLVSIGQDVLQLIRLWALLSSLRTCLRRVRSPTPHIPRTSPTRSILRPGNATQRRFVPHPSSKALIPARSCSGQASGDVGAHGIAPEIGVAGWPIVYPRRRRRRAAACLAAAIRTSCLCPAAVHPQAQSPAVLVLSRQFALPVLTLGHPAAAHRSHL
jgi:hypothetical protein